MSHIWTRLNRAERACVAVKSQVDRVLPESPIGANGQQAPTWIDPIQPDRATTRPEPFALSGYIAAYRGPRRRERR